MTADAAWAAVFVLAMSAGMAVFELAENRFGKLAR